MISRHFSNQVVILYFLGMIALTGFCLLIPLYFPGFRGEFDPSEMSYHNKPIGAISKGKIFIQEYTTQQKYLQGIEIMLATWNRNNTNTNQLAILDERYKILATQSFKSANVVDNSFHAFNFPKDVFIGKGNRIFICLYSENGNDANSITAWSDSTLQSGNLFQSSMKNQSISEVVKNRQNALKGELVFKVYESDFNKYLFRILFLLLLSGFVIITCFSIKSAQKGAGRLKKSEIIFSLIFLFWILLPGLYFFILKNKDVKVSEREKRSFAQKPELNISTISEFPERYQNYFDDYFISREDLMLSRSFIGYTLFNKSIFPSKITIGNQGWLFRTGERQFLEGNSNISQQDIAEIVEILHDRALYYREKGIAFYIVLVPLKSDIYREYLPDYYHITDKGIIPDIITQALKEDTCLRIIDLKNTFINTKKEGNVFFKTDFHWSELGAYKAYFEMIKRIQQDFPEVMPLEPKDFTLLPTGEFSGNDAVELGLEDYFSEPGFRFDLYAPKSKEMPKTGYSPPEGFGREREFYEIVRSTSDTSLPSIVVIRDSFFHLLVILFGENFNKSVFIWDAWQYGLNDAIIENEKPDIVLLEAYVNFLPNILKKTNEDIVSDKKK